MTDSYTEILQRTQHWLDQAVIGLNLCPFAKAVVSKQRLQMQVCDDTTESDLLTTLAMALAELSSVPETEIETTLLIHPFVLQNFNDYNAFLDKAEELIKYMELVGEIQIASFHPEYQFANTSADDITNYTNRSPYPCLHLLRESSIDKAVKAYPDASSIYLRNQETLKELGLAGWEARGLKK